MASVLIGELHGQLLRDIAEHHGVNFQGLRAAASALRRAKVIDHTLAGKLTRLDDCWAVVRHITAVSAEQLRGSAVDQLLAAKGLDKFGDDSGKGGHEQQLETSLQEYVDCMKKGQEYIYYITGGSSTAMSTSPCLETLRKKGFEVMYFEDPADDHRMQQLKEFDGKKFVKGQDSKNEDEKQLKDFDGKKSKFKITEGSDNEDERVFDRETFRKKGLEEMSLVNLVGEFRVQQLEEFHGFASKYTAKRLKFSVHEDPTKCTKDPLVEYYMQQYDDRMKEEDFDGEKSKSANKKSETTKSAKKTGEKSKSAKKEGLNSDGKEFKSMEGFSLNEQQLKKSSHDPKDGDREKSKSAKKTKRRNSQKRSVNI